MLYNCENYAELTLVIFVYATNFHLFFNENLNVKIYLLHFLLIYIFHHMQGLEHIVSSTFLPDFKSYQFVFICFMFVISDFYYEYIFISRN